MFTSPLGRKSLPNFELQYSGAQLVPEIHGGAKGYTVYPLGDLWTKESSSIVGESASKSFYFMSYTTIIILIAATTINQTHSTKTKTTITAVLRILLNDKSTTAEHKTRHSSTTTHCGTTIDTGCTHNIHNTCTERISGSSSGAYTKHFT